MGSFEGHFVPGAIYFFLSQWWAIVTVIRHISSLKYNRSKFKGSTTMPCFCCPTKSLRNFPFESFLKIFGISVHFFMEILTGLHFTNDGDHLTMGPEGLHHICMLSGFWIGSLIEILIYFGVPFPKRVEYFFNLLAFMIQAMLMSGHTQADQGIEYHVHMLWSNLCFILLFVACLETYAPDNFWIVYIRAFFFSVQGTWLVQAAFVIWPKTKNPIFLWGTDHLSLIWLKVSFMLHLILTALLMLGIYVIIYYSIDFFYRFYKKYEIDIEQQQQEIKIFDENHKEYSMLMNDLDED